jgi:hypothetical protein
MKIFIFSFLLLFMAGRCIGQAPDTNKLNYNIDTLIKQRAVFVMDGIVLQKPYHFNPDSIISINIIKHDKAKEWFEGEAQNGLVVIVSRHGAIISYQKKFSTLSRKYKKYLVSHQNNDHEIIYVLNGVQLAGDGEEIVRKIYDSLKKLESVNFIKSNLAKGVYGTPRPVLIISTHK